MAFADADANAQLTLGTPRTYFVVPVSPTDTDSDPLDADADADGSPDEQEVIAGTDPNDPGQLPYALALGPVAAPLLALGLLVAGRRALQRRTAAA